MPAVSMARAQLARGRDEDDLCGGDGDPRSAGTRTIICRQLSCARKPTQRVSLLEGQSQIPPHLQRRPPRSARMTRRIVLRNISSTRTPRSDLVAQPDNQKAMSPIPLICRVRAMLATVAAVKSRRRNGLDTGRCMCGGSRSWSPRVRHHRSGRARRIRGRDVDDPRTVGEVSRERRGRRGSRTRRSIEGEPTPYRRPGAQARWQGRASVAELQEGTRGSRAARRRASRDPAAAS